MMLKSLKQLHSRPIVVLHDIVRIGYPPDPQSLVNSEIQNLQEHEALEKMVKLNVSSSEMTRIHVSGNIFFFHSSF